MMIKKSSFAGLGFVVAMLLFPPPSWAAGPNERPNASDGDRAKKERPSEAHDDDSELPPESGFSFGARLGYALPMGTVAKDAVLGGTTDLSKYAAGMLPVWIDGGYRITPHFYVGGHFQLAPVFTSGDVCRDAQGTSCSGSGSNIRLGAHARYAFRPDAKFSPWVGAGLGYEIINLSITQGSTVTDTTAKGFEFVNLHIGADYRLARAMTVGPILMLSVGQYSSYTTTQGAQTQSSDYTNTALHQWITLGLKGQYDL